MFLLLFMSAAAATAGTVAAASLGIGTANALGAAFLCLINIDSRTAKNSQDNCYNQKINHILFLSAGGQFCFQFLVSIDAQENHNAHHNDNCHQSTKEARAYGAGGD